MKKNALISVSMLLLVGLLAVQLQAQPEIIWYRTYGGDEPEECHSIIHTSDGGFALAGMTQSFEVDWMDFYLVKADVEGNEEWFNVYRKEGDNIGYDLIQTHDSGYALSGGTYYFGRDQDMGEGLLVRTDSDGEEVWTLTYNDFDIGWKSVGVVQTADSGFVVAGNFWLSEEFRQQLCAMKINADREFVWLEDYGEGSAEHHMTDFTGTADNGFAYLCSDYSLTRLDENGEIIWTQSYLDEEHSYSDILIQNSDGGFAIAGEVENYSRGYMVKVNAEGEEIWHCRFTADRLRLVNDILQTVDGGFALTGCDNLRRPNISVVRLDGNSEELWWFVCQYTTANSFCQTEDGCYAFGGSVLINEEGGDIALMMTTPDPVSAPIDRNVSPVNEFSMISAYPNPFNNSIAINFISDRSRWITLRIFDCAGRSVSTLYRGLAESGMNRVSWDAESMPAGIYQIRLDQLSGQSNTKQIVLVK